MLAHTIASPSNFPCPFHFIAFPTLPLHHWSADFAIILYVLAGPAMLLFNLIYEACSFEVVDWCCKCLSSSSFSLWLFSLYRWSSSFFLVWDSKLWSLQINKMVASLLKDIVRRHKGLYKQSSRISHFIVEAKHLLLHCPKYTTSQWKLIIQTNPLSQTIIHSFNWTPHTMLNSNKI